MPQSKPANLDYVDIRNLARLLTDKPLAHKLNADGLLESLDYHGITLLAAEHHALPEILTPAIRKHKAMMVANDTLKQVELVNLLSAFSAAKISAVLFKGSALAYSIYPKSWLRPRSDTDILIAPEDRAKADQICAKLGYRKLFAIQGEYVSYQSTYGKALAGSSSINIDLHWHINNRQMFSSTFRVDELINNAQQLTHFDQTPLEFFVCIPSSVDSILIASIHRAGHHNKEERLAWLYDIHLLANSLSRIEWQQLCNKAQEKKIAAITLNALQTCETLLGTGIDTSTAQQLRQSSEAHEPSSIFLNRELSERHYFWADLQSMPSVSSKLSFLIESVIPPPEYVRHQMGTSWASWAYLKRAIRGIKRVL
jgi:hypothetical protein